MKHTYFFENRKWTLDGTYYDDKGLPCPLYGEVVTSRDGSKITVDGFLRTLLDPPIEVATAFTALEVCENSFTYEAQNPAFGTICGNVAALGNFILSFCKSADNVYSGMETLRQIDDYVYENAGACFINGIRMASWVATLKS